MNTIVLALDGSEGSRRATPVAKSLAETTGAKLVIAHVDERIAAKGDMPHIRADADEIFARINDEADEMRKAGLDVSVEREEVVLGGPAHAIADIADRAGADLIVVGTRGHSAPVGVLLGSVTPRLLHVAKRPVLAVPPTE